MGDLTFSVLANGLWSVTSTSRVDEHTFPAMLLYAFCVVQFDGTSSFSIDVLCVERFDGASPYRMEWLSEAHDYIGKGDNMFCRTR